MTNALAPEFPESRRAQKRRSSRACQSCRAAKTKCEPSIGGSRCRRCEASSTVCFFPASRRGRIRGSKNLRTLEKLKSTNTHGVDTAEASRNGLDLDGSESFDDEDTPSPNADQVLGVDAEMQLDDPSMRSFAREGNRGSSEVNFSDSLRPETQRFRNSGTITPWNPNNFMVNTEGGRKVYHHDLRRKLLQILGEFPIEDHQRDSAESNDSKGLQDPMWLMGGLAKRGWDLDRAQDGPQAGDDTATLPQNDLSPEETQLLRSWTPQALRDIQRETNQYFEHGLLGSKRDVADDLDPILHGLLSEQRALQLFEVYWNRIHPQWAMLDATFHTLSRVRTRSALLTTVILALGSTALAIQPQSSDIEINEALRLHDHTEKLNLIVYATGARSVDIIQAQILLCRYGISPRTRLEEQRWMRSAMIPRMAFEIGLHLPNKQSPKDSSNTVDHDSIRQLQLNDIRARAFVIINEHRFHTFSGRQTMELVPLELSSLEVEDIARADEDSSSTSLSAFYELFLFDRDVRKRIDECQKGSHMGLSLDAELEHIKAYIERWLAIWCSDRVEKHVKWHLSHDALSCWLLLAVRIAKKRLRRMGTPTAAALTQERRKQKQDQQQILLNISTRLFENALRTPDAVSMTHRAAIFPFSASIILRLGSRRDLVARMALRMAGKPGKPYVPTFVREAGNQMLVMLWLVPQMYAFEVEVSLTRAFSTNAVLPEMSIRNDNASRKGASARSHSEATRRSDDHQTTPNYPDEQDASFQGRADLEFHQRASNTPKETTNPCSDSLFNFNMTDFNFVPEPLQPDVDNLILPCFPYADLDSWIGTMSPLGDEFPDANISTLPANCSASGQTCHGASHSVGHKETSSVGSEASKLPQYGSSWGLGCGNDQVEGSTQPPVHQVRDAQREALMAAVDRLTHLASLIQ